jgi:hypothetical protein
VVFDKSGKPRRPSNEVRLKAKEIVESSGCNSVERFNRVVLGAQTFRERAEQWLMEVRSRRFKTYKETTLPTISCPK